MTRPAPFDFDLLLIGGGITGLWLASTLNARGYRVALFEAETLGHAQSLAAQGIIHSGIKYGTGERATLRTGLAAMPDRWRACLKGQGKRGDPDLSKVSVASELCLLFSGSGALDRLRQFAASHLLRSPTSAIDDSTSDGTLQRLGFHGSVVAVEEPVLPVPATLAALHRGIEDRCYQRRLSATDIDVDATGVRIRLGGQSCSAQALVLCAGLGNETFLSLLGERQPQVVRKPLHQVIVQHPTLPPLFGHCLQDSWTFEPRFTVTSHLQANGRWAWYLGGALATGGCDRSEGAQCKEAKRLLEQAFPSFDWRGAVLSTLKIDRAEPISSADTGRAVVVSAGPVHGTWPIKLALAPDAADQLIERLPPPLPAVRDPALSLPLARVGSLTWLSP